MNFIVRAVDDILKESFGIPGGLADDNRVTVLDFACGTGTFLLEVFQRIFDNIGGPDAGRADLIVCDHLLRNVFGFEYLIAPYTIAHLKLSQYLSDQGHPLKGNERLQVLLTNTLEPIKPQANFLLPAISAEVEAAQTVKDREILAIVGNPPYSGESKNKGPWIRAAIGGYKFTFETNEAGLEVRKPLGERNPKWLNDDYVKFIRFAQLKMDAVEEGVVGVITNHSWLDNPTFRGMRQSLMRSFEQIYVLDLHGNAKKKERSPDGSDDQNVFDIEQGVATSLFVKRRGLERGVWRGDFWGKRLAKYETAAEGSIGSVAWQPANPASPYYAFRHEDADRRSIYDKGWLLPAMLLLNSVGIVTGRDKLAVHFSKAEAYQTIRRFSTVETEEARREYHLGPDAQDWKVAWAQEDIRATGAVENRLIQISYQPFDSRWTYYTGKPSGFHVRPRRAVSDAMLKQNLAIVSNRSQEIPGEWSNVLAVANQPATHHTVSNKEVNTVFPLYAEGFGSKENFSPDFRAFIDARYEHHYTPEEILGYIYAVLHAPTYRTRYAEFLRIDFPRVPFPESADDFETLSVLGWALVQAHLFREPPRQRLAAYGGKGGHTVEAVRNSPEQQAIAINKSQFFKPVPQAVWDFHIGGYQVLDKYLKSRKGRVLSLDEINHVSAIADSLAFTIEKMARIDDAYRAAFEG